MKRSLPPLLVPPALAALCAAHLFFSLAFSLAAPSFEKPDEPGHLDYIRFLSNHHRLPLPLPEFPFAESAYEGQQVPLYYFTQAFFLSAIDSRRLADFETEIYNEHGLVSSYRTSPEAAKRRTLRPNPRSHAFGGHEANVFERDARDSFPYEYPYSVFRALRLSGVLWGLLTVCLTYHLSALALGPRSSWALAATALVALNPQFCFAAGSVSNDSMAIFLSGLFTYLGVRFACDPRKRRPLVQAALLGLVLGLALLSKLNTLALALFVVACLVVGSRWRPRLSIYTVGTCLLAAAAVSGWYFVRNAMLFGDPWSLETVRLARPHLISERSLLSPYFLSLGTSSFIPATFETFWACFGWMNVRVHPMIINSFLALSLAGSTGVLAWLFIGSRTGFSGRRAQLPLILLLILHCSLSFAFMIRFNMTFPQPQGRYLFVSLPAIGILLAFGMRFWLECLTLSRARLRTLAPFSIMAILTILIILCLLELLRRY